MNSLAAQKIKRRGVKAIELALKDGPVHIIKNNSPTYVVLTEAQYAMLTAPNPPQTINKNSLLQWLLHKKSTGTKTRKELDRQLTVDRDAWDR